MKQTKKSNKKTVKRFICAAITGLVVTAMATSSFAELAGSASAKVFVKVDPNIALQPLTSIVSAGSVQQGNFSAVIRFRVDANREAVTLSVGASPLFKGDDPTNTDVAPIPLANGVVIQPEHANPINSGTNIAEYGSPCDVDGFPGLCTNEITFESSQNGHFSQDVDTTVTWTQDDPEKPMGEYSGKVKLTALVLPETI